MSGADHGLDPVLAQEIAALAQKHRVAHRRLDVFQGRSGDREEVDMDPDEGLVDDVEPAFRQQPVDVGHPAIGRVLHRQHGQVGLAPPDRLDDVLEGLAGHRLHHRVGFAARLVRIGARLSLERDLSWHSRPCLAFGVFGRLVAAHIS